MKCVVIYFSLTGNTEKVAFAIQTGIKQVAGSCDIVKIKDANPRRLSEYDLIGIGSPVGEVINVWDFIDNMRFVGGKHAFIFCTHGSEDLAGRFYPNINKRIKARGLTLIGTADWYGNCYLLHHTYPYPAKGHPDEIDLKEAADFGREIVIRSWRITAGKTELVPPTTSEIQMPPGDGSFPVLSPPELYAPPPTPDKKAPSLNPFSNEIWETISSLPSRVKFHKEKCLYPQCRLCMDNCPVDGIDLSLDPPIIANPCEYCEFCGRVCPTGALDIDDWVKAVAKITPSTFYHYEQAEAKGTFRRLLPKEELKADVYGYMVYTKHPQWIIGKGPQMI
jgi:flavodoxin/ferredoxin